jgi:O-methyltransferase domain/Dimerisation domain
MTMREPALTLGHMAHPDVTERAPIEQMAFAAMSAKIVYAAAELCLPDALAGGGRTSAELADRVGAHAPSLRRLLRALAGLGVVDQTGPDSFELAAPGEPLRRGVPDSVHALITMLCGPENWASWGELVTSVRTGRPGWNLVHDLGWVDYYEGHPERFANFNRAMSEHTRDAAPAILAAAELSRFGTLIDVGGGDGTLITQALRENPGLRGGIFDLPAGLRDARTTLEAGGVADRCRLFPGDFFESVPAGADAYLLKHVLHDWDDEPATAILRSVRRAMPSKSTLLLVEGMLPDEAGAADAPMLLIDVLMLVVTGGRERTEAEFAALLADAGFEPARRSEALPPFDYRVIEATPV